LINLLPDKASRQSKQTTSECGCTIDLDNTHDKSAAKPLLQKLREGVVYAFTELLKDIGGWLMLGVLIAGVISYFVPVDFVGRYLGGEYSSLLIMLAIGIPLYMCASASTPIAAALVLKGLSPGAALVFLLVGPATNAATMTVVAKHLGKAATVVYITSIAISSLAAGWLVNRMYAWLSIDAMDWVHQAEHSDESVLYLLSAIILIALLLWNYRPRRKSGDSSCDSHEQPGGG
jgi:uncharacterized membrane protein YraQ (UPF0718 family)